MARSRLLSSGQETATFYPSEWQVNAMGVRLKAPSQVGITRRVTVSGDRQATAELPGQVSTKVVKLLCRPVPGLDGEARVEFRGEEWDLAMPPHHSSGASRATLHDEITLRSRNATQGG